MGSLEIRVVSPIGVLRIRRMSVVRLRCIDDLSFNSGVINGYTVSSPIPRKSQPLMPPLQR